MKNEDLQLLAQYVEQAQRVVVFTGAGCSTEAGLPDFRSPGGWWKQINPEEIANPGAMAANYPLFHEFYSHRVNAVHGVAPHRGHEVLAAWERLGKVRCVVTQNVDGLHQAAGNQDVVELHGTIRRFRCHQCQGEVGEALFLAGVECPHCGATEKLRPNIVMFTEMLPQEAWLRAGEEVRAADLLIVIGSSLKVSPANQLPNMCQGKKVFINAEYVSGCETLFDFFIEGRAGEVLGAVHEIMGGE